MKQLTREEVEAVVERFAGNRIGSLAKFSIMPIRLGEVLDKMQTHEDGEISSVAAMEFSILELLDLWQPLGFSRSLQEIVQASGWEYTLTARDEDSSIRKAEVLTSPEANALFSFLQEIV